MGCDYSSVSYLQRKFSFSIFEMGFGYFIITGAKASQIASTTIII